MVAGLCVPLGVTSSVASVRTPELIRCICNAFHAPTVAFASKAGTLASQSGAGGTEMMNLLCRDTRLNTSPAYLKPGIALC